ncbi:hypothetical protein DFP73DRAFT_561461 [Morchella snyderi]|nr:hypothetical protein DFP73DRAFT_561461 [Morchella snyderi]
MSLLNTTFLPFLLHLFNKALLTSPPLGIGIAPEVELSSTKLAIPSSASANSKTHSSKSFLVSANASFSTSEA